LSLPKRTADTMSEAIALSSPNGSMSKRAKEAAVARLGRALFGGGSCFKGGAPSQPSERERLLERAKQLRDLAARGMKVKAYVKEAERLEIKASNLPANFRKSA